MLHKILFAGPVGAGKSSAIRVVSDSKVVQTEARATDSTAERKQRTTVAMDYGTLKISDSVTIQLVGSPGQDRFDFMWDILSRGAIGIVILVDNDRPDPVQDLRQYLEAFSDVITRAGAACSIGVTRMDLSSKIELEPYYECVESMGKNIPVFEVDARDRDDVRTMLLALVSMLDRRGKQLQQSRP